MNVIAIKKYDEREREGTLWYLHDNCFISETLLMDLKSNI